MSDNITFEDRVKFKYFEIGSGRATVAYRMDNNRTSNKRFVTFGFAFCSPKDFFSKKDHKVPIYGTVFNETYNKPVKSIVGFTLEKGGRTRAMEMLESNPQTLSFEVTEGENAVLAALEGITHFCYMKAPSWRDKVIYRRTRKGNHELSRDGITVVFDDNGVRMQTPWGQESIL